MPAPDIKARMDAVERLTKLFQLERMVHLGVTGLSLIMLLTSAGVLLYKGKAGPAELTGLFGSSGLITYSAGRLLFMWNEALKLLGATSDSGGLMDTAIDTRVDALGRASRKAALLSMGGFLLVLGALGYALISLRRLERESAELELRNSRLRVELATGAQQRDSLRAVVSQARRAVAATRAAINAFHAGRLEDALKLYGDALDADPENAYVRNLQAYALFRLGRLPDALDAQRKSIAADSMYAWGYFDLARFLCATDRDSVPAARAAALRAIALRAEMREIMRADGEFRRVCGGQLP
jgi:tetratricopeptide (TPR) repeat protein